MSSQTRKNRRKKTRMIDQTKETEAGAVDVNRNWLPLGKGVRLITVISLALGLWTSYNTVRALGWAEGLFWGFAFGGSIWLVFFLVFVVNSYFRRRPPR